MHNKLVGKKIVHSFIPRREATEAVTSNEETWTAKRGGEDSDVRGSNCVLHPTLTRKCVLKAQKSTFP